MSLLSVFDERAVAQQGASPEVRGEVMTEVIDAINREYPPALLQRPSDADRQRVSERVSALVTQALRRRGELHRQAVGLLQGLRLRPQAPPWCQRQARLPAQQPVLGLPAAP